MKIRLGIALALGLAGCANEPVKPAEPAPPAAVKEPEKEVAKPEEKPKPAVPPAATAQLKRARLAKVQADFLNIEMAAKLFFNEYGRYPALMGELFDPPRHPDGTEVSPFLPSKDGAILDPWGDEYIYELRGDEVFIQSLGPDGEPGGGDDISNEKK